MVVVLGLLAGSAVLHEDSGVAAPQCSNDQLTIAAVSRRQTNGQTKRQGDRLSDNDLQPLLACCNARQLELNRGRPVQRQQQEEQ